MLTLVAGDLVLVIFWRQRAALYLDDVLKDTFMFGLLGLLAAVTYQGVEMYLNVRPNLGPVAMLIYLLFLSMTENSRHKPKL